MEKKNVLVRRDKRGDSIASLQNDKDRDEILCFAQNDRNIDTIYLSQIDKRMNLRVALVHDYLKEFGGAERVLKVLSEMYPSADIYTAFCDKHGSAYPYFKDQKIIESPFAWMIRKHNLHSVLRFLIPWIWDSFDLREYDVVITSASAYVTKGVITHPHQKHVCYVHTPPRFLYGYRTPTNLRKWWIVRAYQSLIAPFLRKYDYWCAQRPDVLVANSNEVKNRIKKFYRRDAQIIYPPVEVEKFHNLSKGIKKQGYVLVVSRLVGTKGVEMSLEAQRRLGFELKIVGEVIGKEWQDRKSSDGVEWLGRVSDEELGRYYAEAEFFLALAEDEDFGMTVVEALACGTPVVAYNGGGYRETVVDGKTGVLFDGYTVDGLVRGIERLKKLKISGKACYEQAKKFSRERFEEEMGKLSLI